MRQSVTRDALRRIEDIVAQATGKTLNAEMEAQIESVLDRLIGATGDGPAGENFAERDVTILLADLRGFTAITAAYPSGVVLDLLNRCFVRMSEIIFRHHGMIDKFMGDSIMVIFFGDRAAPGDDVRRALHCAMDMQLGMQALNAAQRKSRDAGALHGHRHQYRQGDGRHCIGSDLYSEYTVIGEEVNLASRIEAFSLRGQVLISESTYGNAGTTSRAGEPMEVYVKGRSGARAGCARCSPSRRSTRRCRGRRCAAARASK